MAITRDEQQLIARWIVEEPNSYAPDQARLQGRGVELWALIGCWQGYGGDIAAAARDYDLPLEAVEAAVAYYQRHHRVIDARIILNNSRFE